MGITRYKKLMLGTALVVVLGAHVNEPTFAGLEGSYVLSVDQSSNGSLQGSIPAWSATGSVGTPETITFTAPNHAPGSVLITLYNGAVQVPTIAFTYIAPLPVTPVITSPTRTTTPVPQKIIQCISPKRSYTPIGKVCLKGYTPRY